LGYTLIHLSEPDATGQRSYWKLWVLGIFAVLVLCLLHWGGRLLVTREPLPPHVDAAVVLHGSVASEKARIASAMALLQRGAVDHVAISIPRQWYFDEDLGPIARQYLEKTYGSDLAGRVEFCQAASEVSSTGEEAEGLSPCVQKHGWKTLALVTSNYNSRRAGMVWKKTLRDPSIRVWVDGVDDPDYQPQGWWRQRLYAKVWCTEVTKLVWTLV
jgi:uncharacterized SAM-binding protein YcdF (DUF218 family)